jgi:glutamate racemase
LLSAAIRNVMGPRVALVDSGRQTAAEVRGVLAGAHAFSSGGSKPRYRFFVTDEPQHFVGVGHRFVGQLAGSVERVNGH